GRLAAIHVNEVHDVRRIDAAALAPLEALGARSSELGGDSGSTALVPPSTEHRAPSSAFLTGIAKLEGALVMILDVDRLLALSEGTPEADPEEPGGGERAGPAPSVDAWTPEEQAVLRERAVALARRIEAQDVSNRLPLAVVRLNDEPFGIDLAVV